MFIRKGSRKEGGRKEEGSRKEVGRKEEGSKKIRTRAPRGQKDSGRSARLGVVPARPGAPLASVGRAPREPEPRKVKRSRAFWGSFRRGGGPAAPGPAAFQRARPAPPPASSFRCSFVASSFPARQAIVLSETDSHKTTNQSKENDRALRNRFAQDNEPKRRTKATNQEMMSEETEPVSLGSPRPTKSGRGHPLPVTAPALRQTEFEKRSPKRRESNSYLGIAQRNSRNDRRSGENRIPLDGLEFGGFGMQLSSGAGHNHSIAVEGSSPSLGILHCTHVVKVVSAVPQINPEFEKRSPKR